MRDIANKQDNVDVLSAAEFNGSIMEELENSVTASGITLDPAAGPDTDNQMLAQSMVRHAQGAISYEDSGSANAYVLTAINSNFVQPDSYVDGMLAYFQAGNANTGASTINISSIGVKDLVNISGSALTSGEIAANSYYLVQYDQANDRFVVSTIGITFASNATSNTGTATDESLTPANFGTQQSLSASGYQRLPGGIILQWGRSDGLSFGDVVGPTITFPLAFPTACVHVNTQAEIPDFYGSNSNTSTYVDLGSITASQFTAIRDTVSGTMTGNLTWFAIGH